MVWRCIRVSRNINHVRSGPESQVRVGAEELWYLRPGLDWAQTDDKCLELTGTAAVPLVVGRMASKGESWGDTLQGKDLERRGPWPQR